MGDQSKQEDGVAFEMLILLIENRHGWSYVKIIMCQCMNIKWIWIAVTGDVLFVMMRQIIQPDFMKWC